MPRSKKKPQHRTDIFYDRIRAAVPAARRSVADGIDPNRVEFDEELDLPPIHGLTDEQRDELVAYGNAMYVHGLAVGLLLDPALIFATKGGE